MPIIALHAFDPRTEQTLRHMLRDQYKLINRRRPELVIDLVTTGMADIVISELSSGRGIPTAPLIAQVHAVAPAMPILGYISEARKSESLRLVPGAVRAGITDVIAHDHPNLPGLLTRITTPSPWQALRTRFDAELAMLPDAKTQQFCTYVLDNAMRATSFRDTLVTLDVTARQIQVAFILCGLATPERLFASVRMLAALALLHSGERRAEDIAPVLGYRTGDALRRALLRITGYGVREGCPKSAFDMMVEEVREQLNVSRLGKVRPKPLRAPVPNCTVGACGLSRMTR